MRNIDCMIGIVVSKFHETITEELLNSTLTRLKNQEITQDQIKIIHVPGTLEIPLAAQQMAFFCDAVICLGTVIRKETSHYDIVCQESARSLSAISLNEEIPIINGILTVENEKQAKERVGRGSYFADAALQMIDIMSEFDDEYLEDEIIDSFLDIPDNFEVN